MKRLAAIAEASPRLTRGASRGLRFSYQCDDRHFVVYDVHEHRHPELRDPRASGMKSVTEYLTFNLPERMAFRNITPQLEQIVQKSGVKEGLLLCNAMHITASVFINDDEPGLHEDYKKWLEGLAPFDASPQRYKHNRTGEDNADAHMKRQVMGREVVIAITNGKLDFGPWEQSFTASSTGGGRSGCW